MRILSIIEHAPLVIDNAISDVVLGSIDVLVYCCQSILSPKLQIDAIFVVVPSLRRQLYRVGEVVQVEILRYVDMVQSNLSCERNGSTELNHENIRTFRDPSRLGKCAFIMTRCKRTSKTRWGRVCRPRSREFPESELICWLRSVRKGKLQNRLVLKAPSDFAARRASMLQYHLHIEHINDCRIATFAFESCNPVACVVDKTELRFAALVAYLLSLIHVLISRTSIRSGVIGCQDESVKETYE